MTPKNFSFNVTIICFLLIIAIIQDNFDQMFAIDSHFFHLKKLFNLVRYFQFSLLNCCRPTKIYWHFPYFYLTLPVFLHFLALKFYCQQLPIAADCLIENLLTLSKITATYCFLYTSLEVKFLKKIIDNGLQVVQRVRAFRINQNHHHQSQLSFQIAYIYFLLVLNYDGGNFICWDGLELFLTYMYYEQIFNFLLK